MLPVLPNPLGYLPCAYHAVLIATQLNIPTVALAYDPKVDILATQLKLVNIPIERLSEADIADAYAQISVADPFAVEALHSSAGQGFQVLTAWLKNLPK